MLETFQLKKHLDAARQELSQALYQHDAACRVISRLVRERDEARAMMASAKSYATAAASAAGGAGAGAGASAASHVIDCRAVHRFWCC